MNTIKKDSIILFAVLCSFTFASVSCPPALAAPKEAVLTLNHLKNGNYLVPDLACGYTPVQLKNGQGEADGIKVVFGQAIFGDLTGAKKTTAVVHLAYHTQELGWLQQLAFIQKNDNKLVQVADYILDDRCRLISLSVKNADVWVETTQPDDAGNGETRKLTRIHLSPAKTGCLLEACEFTTDASSGKLVPAQNLAPYISTVETRVGRLWRPTSVDRGEHVMVAFKIKPSGDIGDLTLSNSSEIQSANLAALKAVEEAAPFPPLPGGSEAALPICLDFQSNVSVKQ